MEVMGGGNKSKKALLPINSKSYVTCEENQLLNA